MPRKARVGDGHDEFRDGLLEASQLLSKKPQATNPPLPTCPICRADALLYRGPVGPCPHSESQPLVAVAEPEPHLAQESIPELRVHQITPTANGNQRCRKCHLAIPVGETFIQIDIGRWGAPRLGEFATLAFCLRCLKKEG